MSNFLIDVWIFKDLNLQCITYFSCFALLRSKFKRVGRLGGGGVGEVHGKRATSRSWRL